MVRVPIGGRKKKLKQSADKIDIGTTYLKPQAAEMIRIPSKRLSATVVGLTCTYLKYSATMTRTMSPDIPDLMTGVNGIFTPVILADFPCTSRGFSRA
jgi:hypothetical protein